ncbi:hypothetical protein MCOR29_009758 [Pyricularia oryzae]|nr:hypothetical protein MCOR29_009758 [Pyricularia oryzae]
MSLQRLFVLNPATDMTGNHSFTIFIAGASAVGPLVASVVFQYSPPPRNWVDSMWICAALAAFNVFLLIVTLPESGYHREEGAAATGSGIQNIDLRGPGLQGGSSDAKKTAIAEAQE